MPRIETLTVEWSCDVCHKHTSEEYAHGPQYGEVATKDLPDEWCFLGRKDEPAKIVCDDCVGKWIK